MANELGKIDHIVQLMLENRSFDHMLGFLYADLGNRSPAGQDFDGLTGEEWNPDDLGRQVKVYRIEATDQHHYLMPGADPGEGFYNTNYQLFSNDDPGAGAVPNNKGFVINFKAAIASDLAKHYKDTLPGTQPSQIMGMYTPELLPILSGLAKGFAVCDAWFSSVPSMTIPNRTFALAGTSQGHMDDHIKISTSPRIFGRLSDKGLDWAIFGDGTIGEFGFDFTRFGVRVPAVLVSPLIAAGTVYRAAKGRIDHTSVLKTIHERWDTDPLTQREPGGCIAR